MTQRIPGNIQSLSFDVIVVGAGINGAGIARDAAMRGLKVLLLDKGDISDGTTSWSGRMIHGGLRYLEHYEVPLVRESLRDRERLLHIAPHLVRPWQLMIPIYNHSKRGPGMIRLGMLAYDVLSFDKSLPNHRMFNREQALQNEPGLDREGLKGAALYYDAQVEYAERLAVENAVSAGKHGATILTYAKVERLIVENGNVTGVEFRDVLNGGSYSARAPVTVNAGGAWVDEVLKGMGSSPTRFMGGTKGSHIVVDPFPGAPTEKTLYAEARKDGRPYVINAWNGRYLIGTTDLRYEGDLDHVVADDEEIDYLLDETNRLIPQANLTHEDVLFTYSGVRPLPYAREGEEGAITRSHVIYDHAEGKSAAGGKLKVGEGGPRVGGLLSIIGGKLTTYPTLSRQTVNKVYKKLGRKAPKSRAHKTPLPGGATDDFNSFAEGFKASRGSDEWLCERLLRLYGVRAPEVLEIADEDPSLKTPLSSPATIETGLIGAEILWGFREELAQTLSDVLLRRSMVGMGPRVGLDVDEAASEVAVKHLHWDSERAEREVKRYRDFVKRYTPKMFREIESARA